MTKPVFELVSLTKTYGEGPDATRVFDGLSCAAPACGVLGIEGPSGGGKSTLLNLLAGIDAPTSGVVRVLGSEVRYDDRRGLAWHRGRVGHVFQSSNLIAHLTAVENVAMPLLLRGAARGSAMAIAGSWLGEMGLGDLRARRQHALSGGQRQRVAIARALASGARLVLADEPTSALDPAATDQVLQALRSAADDHGCAVVVVSHDGVTTGACDAVLRCEDGELAALENEAVGAVHARRDPPPPEPDPPVGDEGDHLTTADWLACLEELEMETPADG